jgi:hypothetical protein
VATAVNKHRRGSVVELLGAPASGKSALAEALAEVDGVTVVKDHRRSDLAALAWAVVRSWRVAAARPPRDVNPLRWAAWTGRLSAATHMANTRLGTGAATVVFDQGPAYTLVRMLELRHRPAGNKWWWDRCLETASSLDLLVLLDAENVTLARRISLRDKEHRAAELPTAELDDYLTAERRGCHLVADILANEGTEVHRIVTTATPIEEQVRIIQDALARHTRHHVR